MITLFATVKGIERFDSHLTTRSYLPIRIISIDSLAVVDISFGCLRIASFVIDRPAFNR